MAVGLHLSPLAKELSVRTDQKRRPLDAAHLAPVHILHFDHVELLAQLLIGIRNELEGKAHLGLEILVRLQAVARHSCDDCAGFDELLVQIAELAALGGTSRSVVLGVEIQHNRMAAMIRELEGAAGRGDGKIGDFIARHCWPPFV